MGSGVLAGYPIVDVRIELVDGSYHEVDSSERAFKIAGSLAFKEAMKRAKPTLLEPVMAVEVTTPEEFLGDLIGNLNSHRRIESMNPLGNVQVDQGDRPAPNVWVPPTSVGSTRRAAYPPWISTTTKTFRNPIASEIIEQRAGGPESRNAGTSNGQAEVRVHRSHVNVGTIGHIDHGKTTLTAAITRCSQNRVAATRLSRLRVIDAWPRRSAA